MPPPRTMASKTYDRRSSSSARSPVTALSFFFECTGPHRDLHSFPTRRSSDLRHEARVAERVRADEQAEAGSLRHAGRGKDRKSTRLNSSHVEISYAVFCLT